MVLAYFFQATFAPKRVFFQATLHCKGSVYSLTFQIYLQKKTTEPCGWVAFRECEVVSSFYFSLSTCAERAGR